ncbi:hypothetical protein C1645_840764 [Glomus cerebriforme]|uniref:BTB domain-containing protein n=1 Tax=Glomus cerebriforme TaxID=658196 RepID=A0A397S4Z0_9GLOM|nr:hypothetical protein C1645_840764 [Glomus cerebriforme]
MDILLEFTYTGSIKEVSLNKDIIESFRAADNFQLLELWEFIIKTIKTTNYTNNYSPELLSKAVNMNIIPLSEDNILLNLLPFATPEYEVFRYSAILAAKQVFNDTYHQKIAKELESLIKFIVSRRIKGQILADIIDPLEIISANIILNTYLN